MLGRQAVFLLNTRGRLAHEPAALAEAVADAASHAGGQRPALLVCTETWVRPSATAPPLQGYSLVVSVPGRLAENGRGRGGVAIYAASDVVSGVRVWGVPREGIAWVQVQGLLDRPLHLAACYIPPQQTAAALSAFYSHLLRDVLEAHAYGYVAVAGDLNARTGTASEEAAGAA